MERSHRSRDEDATAVVDAEQPDTERRSWSRIVEGRDRTELRVAKSVDLGRHMGDEGGRAVALLLGNRGPRGRRGECREEAGRCGEDRCGFKRADVTTRNRTV